MASETFANTFNNPASFSRLDMYQLLIAWCSSLVTDIGNLSQGSGCTKAVAVVAPGTRESTAARSVPPGPVSVSNSELVQVLSPSLN